MCRPFFSVLNHICKHPELILTTECPLMSLVLMAEFLQKLSEAGFSSHSSLTHSESLIKIAECFINEMTDEEELTFFLSHKDWMGRKALDIITINKYYSLLQQDDVGVMIIKNWHSSSLNNSGLFGASRLYNALTDEKDPEQVGYLEFFKLNTTRIVKSEGPIQSQRSSSLSQIMEADEEDEVIEEKFVFQYRLWPKSCYLRYLASSMSNCLLFLFYLIVLIRAVDKDVMHDLQDEHLQPWLMITNIWILLLTFERFTFLIYALKTDKLIVIDVFYLGDVIMLIMTIFQMIDFTQYYKFGYGSEKEQAIFTNGVLISSIFLLIGLKIVGIVKTTKLFGPFIGMLYSMSIFVFYFMVVAVIWIVCYAGIFCALFHNDNADFADYFTAFRTIFNGFVAAFNFDNFSTRTVDLGRTMFFCYILFATIYLLNLLIAVLSNVYSELLLVIEAEYRSNVNNTYNRFKWDKKYGSLIFGPPPINIFCIFFYPFLAAKNPKKINTYFTQFMHFFIALFLFIVFLIGDIIFLPFAYLKGFIYASMPTAKYARWLKIPIWAFFGIFAVILGILLDIKSYWLLVYRKPKKHKKKKNKNKNTLRYTSLQRNEILQFFTNSEGNVVISKLRRLKSIIDEYVDKEQFVRLKHIQKQWKDQTAESTKDEALMKIKKTKETFREVVRKMTMKHKQISMMKFQEKGFRDEELKISARSRFRRALIQLGKKFHQMESAQDKFLKRFCNVEGTDIDIDLTNRILTQRMSEEERDTQYLVRVLHTQVPIIEEAINNASPDEHSKADFVKVKMAYKEARKMQLRVKELLTVLNLKLVDDGFESDDEQYEDDKYKL